MNEENYKYKNEIVIRSYLLQTLKFVYEMTLSVLKTSFNMIPKTVFVQEIFTESFQFPPYKYYFRITVYTSLFAVSFFRHTTKLHIYWECLYSINCVYTKHHAIDIQFIYSVRSQNIIWPIKIKIHSSDFLFSRLVLFNKLLKKRLKYFLLEKND